MDDPTNRKCGTIRYDPYDDAITMPANDNFLQEQFVGTAYDYYVSICRACGNVAATDFCQICQTGRYIRQSAVSYSHRLFIQELSALHGLPKTVDDDDKLPNAPGGPSSGWICGLSTIGICGDHNRQTCTGAACRTCGAVSSSFAKLRNTEGLTATTGPLLPYVWPFLAGIIDLADIVLQFLRLGSYEDGDVVACDGRVGIVDLMYGRLFSVRFCWPPIQVDFGVDVERIRPLLASDIPIGK